MASNANTIAEPVAGVARAEGWRVRLAFAAQGVLAGVQRFPVTVAMLAVVALRVNWPFGAGFQQTLRQLDDYQGLVATGVLPLAAGAVLALAGSLLAEARGWGRAVSISAAVAGGLIGFALIHWHVALSVYFGSALPAIGGAVLIAPYLRQGSGAQLWRYLMRLGRAALLAGVAALVAGAAFSLLLAVLSAIFRLGLTEQAYFRAWSLAFLLVAPLTGLSLVPRTFGKAAALDSDRLDVSVIRLLLDLLIVPFLLIYAGLLHAYALIVLVSRDVPDGQTGLFVLVFGIALLAGVAVVSHFVGLGGKPSRLLMRIWPWLLPAPVILLFVAGAIRISEAGITPDRYLFVLFGVVLAITAGLQFHPRTRGDIRYLLIVPVIALFVASFGPQGALATSIRSQTERFQALVKPPPYTADEALAARTALYLLDRYNAMEPVLPPTIPATDNDGDTALRARVAEAYGLNRIVNAPAR